MSKRNRRAKPSDRSARSPLPKKGGVRPIRPARDAELALMRKWRSALKYRRFVRKRLTRMLEILRLLDFVPAKDVVSFTNTQGLSHTGVTCWSGRSTRAFTVVKRYVLGSFPVRMRAVLRGHRCIVCGRAHSTLSCYTLLQAEISYHRSGDYLGLSDPERFLKDLEAQKASRFSLVSMIARKVLRGVVKPVAGLVVASRVVNSASYVVSGRTVTSKFQAARPETTLVPLAEVEWKAGYRKWMAAKGKLSGAIEKKIEWGWQLRAERGSPVLYDLVHMVGEDGNWEYHGSQYMEEYQYYSDAANRGVQVGAAVRRFFSSWW